MRDRVPFLRSLMILGFAAVITACDDSSCSEGAGAAADAGADSAGDAEKGDAEKGDAATAGDSEVDPDAEAAAEAAATATIALTVHGDGQVTPATSQTVPVGESVTFTVQPRLPACEVSFGGDCDASANASLDEVVVTPASDCELVVDMDCGPSTLELRPQNVGVFWENRTQAFTATQVFESGERVDVTEVVQWTSTDDSVVSFGGPGLATAQQDHGIVDVTAALPTNDAVAPVQTTLTVVNVTYWHQDFLAKVPDEYPVGKVYLDNVVYASGVVSWDWGPRIWEANYDGVSGRLWAIWSTDDGLTYQATAWDWIGNTTSSKGRANGATHSMWMGTMLSSVCDQPGGTFCNGRERTNIYFSPGVP